MALLLFSIIVIFIYLFSYFNMDSMARNYLRGYRSCFVFLWLLPRFSFLVIIFIYFDMASTVRTTCIVTIIFLFFFLLYISIFIITIFSLFICIFLLLLFLYPFISGFLVTL